MLSGQYESVEVERDLLWKELEEERVRSRELETRLQATKGRLLFFFCPFDCCRS